MEPELHKRPVRYYEIDLLRFLAAISVVLYHYTYRAYMQGNFSPVAYTRLGGITKYGWLGVQLFFIISGYVVLLSAYGKTFRQFFISRTTRLYPAFWVAVTLTFCFTRLFGPNSDSPYWNSTFDLSFKDYLINMTMLYGFTGSKLVDSAYWSLTIELSFYFIIALIILSNNYRNLPLIILLWLGYATIHLFIQTMPFGKILFPIHASYFAAGMLFYMIQNKWFSNWKLYGLLLLTFILSLKSLYLETEFYHNLFHDNSFSLIIPTIMLCLFYIAFFLIITQSVELKRFSFLGYLGRLTYPLYLIHSTIGFILYQRLGGHINKYLILLLLLATMLLIAYTIHTIIEKPLSKLMSSIINKMLAKI